MGMSDDDELVSDYLRHLEAAASGLPADRRRELLEEITTHIAEARSVTPDQVGGVRAILDQLGAPEEIVRADGIGAGVFAGPSSLPRTPDRLGNLEIAAIALLLIGGLVIPFVGWVAGVVLLWLSPRWGRRDKLIATLVWPGGLLAPVVIFLVLAGAALFTSQVCSTYPTGTVCTGPSAPPWLAIPAAVVALVAGVAGPIWVAIRLARRANRSLATADEPGQGLLISSMPA